MKMNRRLIVRPEAKLTSPMPLCGVTPRTGPRTGVLIGSTFGNRAGIKDPESFTRVRRNLPAHRVLFDDFRIALFRLG
jgi:hypothetical protein